jgi:hypothetical protein
MNAGMDFDSVRISRAEGGWRYVGRVHEYLTGPDKGTPVVSVGRLACTR